MDVLLIDVDSKVPNLALMQISAYHKARGHNAGFNIIDPDQVYISCIFKKNASQVRGIKTMYPESQVFIGGSGVSYEWLPKEMRWVKPDYDLYPSTYSMGFTTRGCIRNCPFCIVSEKEGKFQRWQHVSEFHDTRFDTVMLLDNNIFADIEWFFDNVEYIIDNNLKLNITQGMDIRLLNAPLAKELKAIKWSGCLHFAFDNMKDESAVREGIDHMKYAGIDIRNRVKFYVLVGYNTTPEQDVYRCRLLKELGTMAFVMPFVKNKWTNKLARWANRPWIYWSIDIDDYDRSKGR